jgi:tetratricopeptide (TPR) repeat protein
MAASAIVDIFDIVAHGEEPPAPILCATVLQHKGEFDNANRIYEKELKKLEEKVHPLSNVDMTSVAEVLVSIAEIKSMENDLPAAVDYYRRALGMHIGTLTVAAILAPPKPVEVAPSAALAKMLGQNLEAQAAEKGAREKAEAEAALAAQPPTIEQSAVEKQAASATILSGLAGVLNRQNKKADAVKHYDLALEAYEKSEQGKSTDFADALFSVAGIKAEQKHTAEAIELLKRCLVVEKVCSGAVHVRTDQVVRRIDELSDPLTWQVPDPNEVPPTVESVLANWVAPPEGESDEDEEDEEEDEDGA